MKMQLQVLLTGIHLDTAPVERVGKVKPNIRFVRQLQDVVVPDTPGYLIDMCVSKSAGGNQQGNKGRTYQQERQFRCRKGK